MMYYKKLYILISVCLCPFFLLALHYKSDKKFGNHLFILMESLYLTKNCPWNHSISVGPAQETLSHLVIRGDPYQNFMWGVEELKKRNRSKAKSFFIAACNPIEITRVALRGGKEVIKVYHYYLSLPLLALSYIAYKNGDQQETAKYLQECIEISSARCDVPIEDEIELLQNKVKLERLGKKSEKRRSLGNSCDNPKAHKETGKFIRVF